MKNICEFDDGTGYCRLVKGSPCDNAEIPCGDYTPIIAGDYNDDRDHAIDIGAVEDDLLEFL